MPRSSGKPWSRNPRSPRPPAAPSNPGSDPAAAARRSSGFGVALVAGAAFTGAFLLFVWYPNRSYSYDEAITVGVFVKAPSVWTAFTKTFVFNNHPLFSFTLAVARRLGMRSVTWTRVIPAAIGALTVACTAGWAARRWGTVSGVVAGALLATNPVFLPLARTARGYGLVALAGTGASIVMIERRAQDRAGWLWLGVYSVAIAAGVATHLYALLLVAAHATFLLLERRWQWLVALGAGTAAGFVAYAWTWRALLHTSRERRGAPHPEFLRVTSRALLGQAWLAVVIVAVLLVLAAFWYLRRPALGVAAIVPFVLVMAVWKVAKPADLYPRFLALGAVAIAVLVASAVGRQRLLGILAFVAAVAMLWPQLHTLRGHETIEPGAHVVTAARAAGLRPCAIGSASLRAYIASPPEFLTAADASHCDVIVRLESGRDALLTQVRPQFPYRWTYERAVVVSNVPRRRVLPQSGRHSAAASS